VPKIKISIGKATPIKNVSVHSEKRKASGNTESPAKNFKKSSPEQSIKIKIDRLIPPKPSTPINSATPALIEALKQRYSPVTTLSQNSKMKTASPLTTIPIQTILLLDENSQSPAYKPTQFTSEPSTPLLSKPKPQLAPVRVKIDKPVAEPESKQKLPSEKITTQIENKDQQSEDSESSSSDSDNDAEETITVDSAIDFSKRFKCKESSSVYRLESNYRNTEHDECRFIFNNDGIKGRIDNRKTFYDWKSSIRLQVHDDGEPLVILPYVETD